MRAKRMMVMLVALLGVTLSQDALAFYNSSTGRWLSRDPSGEAGGINVYEYVGNDPIRRSDPLGLDYGSRSWPPSMPYYPPPPKPPPQTDPTGFAICRREFASDGSIIDAVVTGIGNLGGGKHTYVHYKECEKCR